MLDVRNLAFSYRGKTVLRDVSFVVSPGEVVSIIGANGTGKTTLLKLLATLMVPERGTVLADGSDAFSHPLKYRRIIGYLPENPVLYEDMMIAEYLKYRANLKGEPAKRIRRRVGEAAEMCRITDLLKSPIRSLSLGLRRRVALADALLLRPRILLLDDFLAGLDYRMRASAAAILSDAAAFSSVIVTGHELDDFARWTSRFMVLSNGVVTTSIPTAGIDIENLKARMEAALEGEVT